MIDNRRRTPWYVVDDLGSAVSVAGAHGDLLVVDIENTLVGYGSLAEERYDAMRVALATVGADDRFRRLAFVSNGRFTLPSLSHSSLTVHAISTARKPHVRWPPLRRFRSELDGAAVYGDQPLTDGMLARNLGGIWIQPRRVHEHIAEEPWWPRLMRSAGRRIIDRRFQRME